MVSRKILIALSLLFCAITAKAQTNVIVTNDKNYAAWVRIASGTITAISSQQGAVHGTTSQVTAGAAGTLAIARPTRRSLLIVNTDATNTVYIGPATVTTGNGIPLKPGQSFVVTSTQLWQVVAGAGSPVVAILDEYD